MKIAVADIVHNEITKQEGRVVRIVKIDGCLGFIVAKANKPSGKRLRHCGDRENRKSYGTVRGNIGQ
jgi:hypothetical protein